MTNLNYLYNPDAVKDIFHKNYFVDKKLGFRVIERGIVLPHKTISVTDRRRRAWGAGGIVDSEGEYIRETHVAASVGEPYTPPPHRILNTAPKPSFISDFFSMFGG